MTKFLNRCRRAKMKRLLKETLRRSLEGRKSVIVNLSDKSPGMQEHAGGLMYLCVWFRKSEIRISNGHTPVDWKPLRM
jgi:hypothetical protein